MKLLTKYLILVICLFTSSCYFNLFQLPNKIVTGGSAGVSIIINYWFKLEPSKIILLISIILLIIDYIFLGLYKTFSALLSTLIYPFFIKLTSNINTYINPNISNILIICIIIGIFSGITTGIVYKIGFNNGGFSIISELIFKYKKIPLSISTFIVNIIIIILGAFSLGIKMLLYSVIILAINSIIIKIILNEKITLIRQK